MRKEHDFKKIYDEFQPKILRYLTRLVGIDEAEDLTQEVFIKISSGLEDFMAGSDGGDEHGRKLSTWIYKIATNRAIDRIRQFSSQKFNVDSQTLSDLAPEDGHLHESSLLEDKKSPSPIHNIINNDMNRCIRNVINNLNKDFSSVIILKDLEGFTNQEIARITGISLATVKMRLHRARAELKEALSRKCSFHYDENNNLQCDKKADSPEQE